MSGRQLCLVCDGLAHQAKTHLSQLIREACAGETVIILKGTVPVAKLTAVSESAAQRPKVGTVTSAPVRYDETTFAPSTLEVLGTFTEFMNRDELVALRDDDLASELPS